MKRSRLPKFFLSSFTALLAVFGPARDVDAAPDTWVFFGCVGDEPGIYRSTLDSESGALGAPERIYEGQGISFLTISPTDSALYAVESDKSGGLATSFKLDSITGSLTKLNSQSIGSQGACHISITPDGATVVTADYGEGKVVSFPVKADGSLAPHDPASLMTHEGSSVNEKRQTQPHAHCVVPSPDGRFIYSADLGVDAIFIYRVSEPGNIVQPEGINAAPKIKNLGGGPRHFAFHPGGNFAYTNLELTSQITAYHVDKETGALTEKATVSTIPDGFSGKTSTSELLCHPSGRFIYCANRGHNSIAAFALNDEDGSLTPLGHEPCGGEIPRNFGITWDGGWIVTANQQSENAGVLKVDQETGKLTLLEGGGIDLPKPKCVRFLPIGH